jgi:hypothetical protein
VFHLNISHFPSLQLLCFKPCLEWVSDAVRYCAGVTYIVTDQQQSTKNHEWRHRNLVHLNSCWGNGRIKSGYDLFRPRFLSPLFTVLLTLVILCLWLGTGCAFNLLAPELFFLILTHSVYKMWIMQEPNTLELWNKLHFEQEKRRVFTMFKIFSTYICWINI